MDLSLPHILLLLFIVLLLFGGRKIPEVMRGLGQGIREFKQGMRPEDTVQVNPPASAPSQPSPEKK
ncbi:MAG TPA: twin-arginine translocase TatA/TatE family subunit [Candidatus Dormibacteraeota bacterium]|nr:twin-arginine translocase TatA/TatE family subunit [Candidatus Dormibacteraeota bacterium]